MLRTVIILTALACAACSGTSAPERAADCEPCAEPPNPFERTRLGNLNDDPDAMGNPLRGNYLDYFGRSGQFCFQLRNDGLTFEAVRDAMRRLDSPQELALRPGGTADPGPAEGLVALMLCQSFMREDDAASLTAYRLLGYLDIKAERGEAEAQDPLWREHALEILRETVHNTLDYAIANYVSGTDSNYDATNAVSRGNEVGRKAGIESGYRNFVSLWDG